MSTESKKVLVSYFLKALFVLLGLVAGYFGAKYDSDPSTVATTDGMASAASEVFATGKELLNSSSDSSTSETAAESKESAESK